MTVTDWPATVSVPVRVAPVVFAATVYVTAPLAVPLAPERIEIHATLLVAVQAQPVEAVTDTEEFAVPPEGAETPVGATPNEQDEAAA